MARSSRNSPFIDEPRPVVNAEYDDLVAFYSEQFRRLRIETRGDLDLTQNLADAATQEHAKTTGRTWKRER